jgi:hypothetical protein
MNSECYKQLCILCDVRRKGARAVTGQMISNWYSPPTAWSCNFTPSYAFIKNKENCTNTLLQSEIKPCVIQESFVLSFAK